MLLKQNEKKETKTGTAFHSGGSRFIEPSGFSIID
jgi:hypothetical protein